MGKATERMRANPRADWRISNVSKLFGEAGVACKEPAGGSHYKIATE